MSIQSCYIVGLGAVGSAYAAKLHEYDPSILRVVASPKRINAYKSNGITVNGARYDFNYISPRDTQPPADVIIVAVKFPDLAQAISDMGNFVGPDTVVLSLLNGILSEEIIGRAIGMQHVLYGFTTAVSGREENDRLAIRYATLGKIYFGEKNSGSLTPRVLAIKEYFDRAGVPCETPCDILRRQWSKWLKNTGVNQASAVLGAPYAAFHTDGPARDLMLMAASEVVAISRYAEINLDKSDLDELVTAINGLNPSYKTSMLQDLEAGRKSELDNFSGAVIELGRRYNVPTPVNETLYRIISGIEQLRRREGAA